MEKQAAHATERRQGVSLRDRAVRDAVPIDGLAPGPVGTGFRTEAARKDLAHFDGLHDGPESAVVVQVGMGDDNRIHAAVSLRTHEGQDDAGACIVKGRTGTAVDQEGASVGTGDEDGVPLSDVEDGDPQRPVGQQVVTEEQEAKGHQALPSPPSPDPSGFQSSNNPAP